MQANSDNKSLILLTLQRVLLITSSLLFSNSALATTPKAYLPEAGRPVVCSKQISINAGHPLNFFRQSPPFSTTPTNTIAGSKEILRFENNNTVLLVGSWKHALEYIFVRATDIDTPGLPFRNHRSGNQFEGMSVGIEHAYQNNVTNSPTLQQACRDLGFEKVESAGLLSGIYGSPSDNVLYYWDSLNNTWAKMNAEQNGGPVRRNTAVVNLRCSGPIVCPR